MKRILLVALAGIVSAMTMVVIMPACVQTILPSEQLQIQEVIEVNQPQDTLYVRAMDWLAKTFRSSKKVIQYEDKVAGRIVGKGIMKVTYLKAFGALDTWFTLTLEIKDNKVRVTISDMFMASYVLLGERIPESPITTQKQLDKVKPEAQKLIASLKDALGKPAEDW